MSQSDFPVDLPSFYSSEDILVHPNFELMRRCFVDEVLRLYENDPFMNRLLIEAGRSVVFFHLLCLSAAYDEANPASWPTARLLRQTVKPFAVASERRIDDIIARFISTGYVRSTPSERDRRAKILMPTEKMLAHDLDWLAAWYKPLHVMFPAPGYGLPVNRDLAYQKMHRTVGCSMFGYAERLMAGNPNVMFFMGREAGMMILMKLVQLTGKFKGGSYPEFSFANIGDSFGISRTHVRLTLQSAEYIGLVRLLGRSVVLHKPLLDAFDRFVADCMSGHDLMFKLAMSRLDRPATLQPVLT